MLAASNQWGDLASHLAELLPVRVWDESFQGLKPRIDTLHTPSLVAVSDLPAYPSLLVPLRLWGQGDVGQAAAGEARLGMGPSRLPQSVTSPTAQQHVPASCPSRMHYGLSWPPWTSSFPGGGSLGSIVAQSPPAAPQHTSLWCQRRFSLRAASEMPCNPGRSSPFPQRGKQSSFALKQPRGSVRERGVLMHAVRLLLRWGFQRTSTNCTA